MQFIKALVIAIPLSFGSSALADPPSRRFPSQDQAEALLKAVDAEKNFPAKRELLRQFMAKHDDTRYGSSGEDYNYYAGNAVGLFLQTASNETEYLALSKELVEQGKNPRARAFALKALGEHYESHGSSAAAKEIYQRLAGPDGEHDIIWNESFSMYAKQKLWIASPEGIKDAKDKAEQALAWEKERANRIPASAYSGPGTDPGPKEDLYRFALISAAILAGIIIYVAFRVRKRGVP
jgi:hypothetical protein